MFKNYFYLNRCVIELNELILNSTILDVYSQEKDRLYLHIPNDEFPDRHLLLSTDQNLPYIQIRNVHKKAKKNTISFYQKYIPAILEKIEIAEAERLIKFTLTSGDLYFMLRGGNSNIFFINTFPIVKNFKKQLIKDEVLESEFINTKFRSNSFIPDLSFLDDKELTFDLLKKEFPFVNREIVNEALLRIDLKENIKNSDQIYDAINNILNEEIAVFYSEHQSKVKMCPSSFISFRKELVDAKTFISFNDAISYLISNKFRNEKESGIKKEIEKYLDKELSFVSNKLNKLKPRIAKGNQEEEIRIKADLLLSNKRLLVKGLKEIALFDYESNKDIKITLDPKKNGQENIDAYYEKARDDKINYEKSLELFNNNEKIYNELLKAKNDFENAESFDDFQKVKQLLGIKDKTVNKKSKMELDIKLRHFIIEGQYHVFVGRDSKSNDLLSTKFAKQNDYWFHARGLPGSHTTLRVDNPKEGVPKDIIKKAASIAAFYSKAKTASVAPVSYTLRKFVHKKKGMAPGKVTLSKENVLLVKPEIPKNTEQVED